MADWVLLCLEAAACDPGGPTLCANFFYLCATPELRNTLMHEKI
jgi:hypothetical protein